MALLTSHAVSAEAPPPDPVGVWSIAGENSSISTARLTDRYYVNGINLGYLSATTSVPSLLQNVADAVLGAGQTRWGFALTQQIFTPSDTAAKNPPLTDRPYGWRAAWQFRPATGHREHAKHAGCQSGHGRAGGAGRGSAKRGFTT